MSPEIYLHEHHDFSDLIRVVAGERRIDPYLVEKDYWLVHSLYGLQKAGYDFQKSMNVVQRFTIRAKVMDMIQKNLNRL